MTAPDESGINKDCTEKSTDWIATDGKRCTDDFGNLTGVIALGGLRSEIEEVLIRRPQFDLLRPNSASTCRKSNS